MGLGLPESLDSQSEFPTIAAPRAVKVSDLISTDAIAGHFEALGKIGNLGPNLEDGFLRASWSAEESAAMEYIRKRGEEFGLVARYDAIGNLYLRTPGNFARVIQMGSHLDTVPEGGNFDGAAGVVAGLEAIRAVWRQHAQQLQHGLELVAWRGEESATFGHAYKGCSAAFGQANIEMLSRKFMGRTLTEAICSQVNPMTGESFNVDCINRGQMAAGATPPDEIVAHLELHIEQGKVLEEGNYEIGIPTSIRGPSRWDVTFEDSDDRLLAQAAVVMDRLGRVQIKRGLDLVQTVGVINTDHLPPDSRLKKCSISIVAGYAEILTTLREVDISDVLKRIAERFKVRIEVENLGQEFLLLKINGTFDHSGGTPMGAKYRRDANLAAAYLVSALSLKFGAPGITINDIHPPTRHFQIDIRSTDKAGRDAYVSELRRRIHQILSSKTKNVAINPISEADPLESFDRQVVAAIEQATEDLGYKTLALPSGAGHDTAVVAKQRRSSGSTIPAGMIFVPCREGLSHCKEEYSSPEQIAAGTKVLAETIRTLAIKP